jgi:hypothetical protein
MVCEVYKSMVMLLLCINTIDLFIIVASPATCIHPDFLRTIQTPHRESHLIF